MKNYKKFLAVAAVSALGLFTLSSCGWENEWSKAGAEVRGDGNIIFISLDEAVEKKNKKEDFVLFLASHTNETACKYVTYYQKIADYENLENCIYLFDTTDYLSKLSDLTDTKDKLGISTIADKNAGHPLVVVSYKNGEVEFDTAVYKSNVSSPLYRFELKDSTLADSDIDYVAIGQYYLETSTVKKP